MAWLLMDTTDAISWAPSEVNSFLVWLKAVLCGREGEVVGASHSWGQQQVPILSLSWFACSPDPLS